MIGGSRSGEVWQAQDGQTGELVAYKLVAPAALPTIAAVERAQRELKQLMRSQSPRIARVLDCGKSPDGRLFIATELCAGEPLDRVIERSGPLSLERTKKIIAQIGEALLEGQKVGVVHHDLSPKNVLIEGDDDVKLINFTVAVPISDRVFGVAEFLSPEQAEGKPADQRSNTYGLGAMAVFLLTGAPPFAGPTPQAVLEQVLRGELAPPSQRRAELTPEIDRVILRAMDKNSSRRPLTLRQFLNEVQSMHLGGAPAARPAASLNRTIAYSGGSPEVRRLVAEATAARAEANGSGPAVAYSPVSAAPAAAPSAPAPAPAAPVAAAPPPASAAPRAVDPAATPLVKVVDPSSQPTPPPVALPQRGHGAAIAATMMAMPAAPPAQNRAPAPTPAPAPAANNAHANAQHQATPPPVVPARQAEPPAEARRPAPAPVAAAASTAQAQPAPAGQGANFRETLWFKKGDVEQMVAEAKAKAASGPVDRHDANGGAELPAEDAKPLEDRYLDDGSLTVEDRKKFSLRAGATAAGVPAMAGSIPGDRMSESEMFNEIGGGKRVKVIAITGIAVAAVVAVLFLTMKGKGPEKAAVPPPAPTAATKAAEEPPAAAPVPAAKAPEAPAPTAAAPTEEAEPPHAKEAAPAHETPPAAAKARSPKRKAAKRTSGKKKH